MKKIYVITFSLSVLVTFAVCVIAYMLMLPQINVTTGDVSSYEAIVREEYKFEKTKDITKEFLEKNYTVTAAQINSFLNKKQYKPGNTDPFTLKNTGNNTGAGTNTNTGTNSGTSGKDTANSNTTNSQNGQANPSAPNK